MWNVDTLLKVLQLQEQSPYIDEDNEGQIIILTNLYEDHDGNLRDMDTQEIVG